MLSKSQAGFIRSLHQKKFRNGHGMFIAEGWKTISEFIASGYSVENLLYTQHSASKLLNLSQKIKAQEISREELSKISALQTPQDTLALIRIPEKTALRREQFKGRFTLALDGVQDPGNLGTIIRTADWFGITQIICSPDCVEAYNPKVVQATMGSLARVKICETDLAATLREAGVPVFGGVLNGKSVYETDFGHEGIILLGNEGKGISPAGISTITYPVTIPRFGQAESLNVAVSAAILCAEMKRSRH
jgi:TrmH family RNA methyltransferase